MKNKTDLDIHHCVKDNAVSPVIGVMLMLVVTIVIAAVIASFATGLISGGSEEAPTTVLDVSLYRGNMKSAVIDSLSGDQLDTEDLLITVAYTLPEKYAGKNLPNGGKTIMHSIDGGLEPIPENDIKTDLNVSGTLYPFVHQTTNNDAEVSKRVVSETKFGEATLVSGSRLVFDLNYFAGFDLGQTNTYGINGLSKFRVTIVHKPSGTVIYDKDVRISS